MSITEEERHEYSDMLILWRKGYQGSAGLVFGSMGIARSLDSPHNILPELPSDWASAEDREAAEAEALASESELLPTNQAHTACVALLFAFLFSPGQCIYAFNYDYTKRRLEHFMAVRGVRVRHGKLVSFVDVRRQLFPASPRDVLLKSVMLGVLQLYTEFGVPRSVTNPDQSEWFHAIIVVIVAFTAKPLLARQFMEALLCPDEPPALRHHHPRVGGGGAPGGAAVVCAPRTAATAAEAAVITRIRGVYPGTIADSLQAIPRTFPAPASQRAGYQRGAKRFRRWLAAERKAIGVATGGVGGEEECCVCLDEWADAHFEPCGHRVACDACASELEACPVCRTVITHRRRVVGLDVLPVLYNWQCEGGEDTTAARGGTTPADGRGWRQAQTPPGDDGRKDEKGYKKKHKKKKNPKGVKGGRRRR